MNKLVKVYELNDSLIQDLINIARKNWDNWDDEFQHGEPIDTNPVLLNPDRFANFRSEYSLNRSIWKGRHEEFRCELLKPKFGKAIRKDDTGRAFDRLEECLRPRFGAKKGKNRLTSVLSKVAAFVKPERFVAWDRFAKTGLNLLRKRSASSAFETYSEYLEAFKRVKEGKQGQQIKAYLAKKYARKDVVERKPGFLPRVLDVYLMKCGGRWSPENWQLRN